MAQQHLKLLDELLSHPRFQEWAVGNAPELDPYWEDWTRHDPDRREVLLIARRIALSFHTGVPTISDEYVYGKINQAISTAHTYQEDDTVDVKRSNQSFIFAAAASLLLLLGLSWGYFVLFSGKRSSDLPSTHVSSLPNSLSIFSNTMDAAQHIVLSDGSSVVLQPNSTLHFPAHFQSDKREVHLQGEAFFEVVKNPHVPFYVLAEGTVTKVIGTSFRVKAKPNSRLLEINVKSGIVAVLRNKIQDDLDLNQIPENKYQRLTQNEHVVFDLNDEGLNSRSLKTQEPPRLEIEAMNFVYESAPINQVFNDLKTAYGVEIIYDEGLFTGCTLTAELSDEPLTKKIDWICKILEAEYLLEGNRIRITGSPCR